MSNVFEAPLRLELTASRQRGAWLIGIHALVLSMSPLLVMPGVRLSVVALTLVSLVWELRTRFRYADREPVLLWRSDGLWEIGTGTTPVSARLDGPAFVHVRLVVLPLRIVGERRRRRIVIFADSLDVDSFRRLRVRLRLQGAALPPDEADPQQSPL